MGCETIYPISVGLIIGDIRVGAKDDVMKNIGNEYQVLLDGKEYKRVSGNILYLTSLWQDG